jgi:hypothetical protein
MPKSTFYAWTKMAGPMRVLVDAGLVTNDQYGIRDAVNRQKVKTIILELARCDIPDDELPNVYRQLRGCKTAEAVDIIRMSRPVHP